MPTEISVDSIDSGHIAMVGVMQKRSDLFDIQKGIILDVENKEGYISEMAVCELFTRRGGKSIPFMAKGDCLKSETLQMGCTTGHRRQKMMSSTSTGNVRVWFEEHQDALTILPWPANSPDLIPIKNLSDLLERVAHATDPHPHNLA
ncbi:DDE_3 domain-containing protein [Trichonephila clavipes]|nr:DDE_3 domain-containing protein [Trichonephila clavipes]